MLDDAAFMQFHTERIWMVIHPGRPAFSPIRRAVSSALWIAVLFACFLFPLSEVRAQPRLPKRILILHSYHAGFSWVDQFNDGVRRVLDNSDLQLDFFFEFMDTKRSSFGSGGLTPALEDYLRQKYTHLQPDLIIVMDDDAFNFVSRYGRTLFPDAPIIFAGVNNPVDPALLTEIGNITGIYHQIDRHGTIDLILRLHPQTKRLAIITDQTTNGIENRRALTELASQYDGRLAFEFLDPDSRGLSLSNLAARLARLDQDTVVYLADYFLTSDGYIDQAISIPYLSQNSSRPIYTSNSYNIGNGALGGRVNNPYTLGMLAGEKARQILNGKPALEIPVSQVLPAEYIFDAAQLQCWNISESQLPAGSQVINRSVSVIERYRSIIITAGIIAAVLLLTIAFLGVALIQYRRSERVIRASEERFRSLFENANDGIVIVDPDSRILDVNQCIQDRLGYSRAELLKMHLVDINDTDSPDTLNLRLQNIMDEGATIFEARHVTSTGMVFPVEINARRIKYNNRPAIMSIVRVLSDARRAEKERSRLASIVEASKNEIFIVNPQTHYIRYANRTALSNLGYSLHDLLAKNLLDLCAEPQHFPYHTITEDLLHSEKDSIDFNTSLRRSDGSVYPVEGFFQRIEEEDDHVFIIVADDTTQKVHAENALRETEIRLALALEEESLGLWEWDIPEGVFTFNQRWAAALGLPPGEVSINVKRWRKVIHTHDQEPLLKEVTPFLNGKTIVFEIEHRMFRNDTASFWVLNRGKAIAWDGEGRPVRAIGTLLDIDQHKQAQQTLIRSEKNLREAQRIAHTGSILTDLTSREITLSDEMYAILGIPKDSPYNNIKDFHQFVYPEDFDRLIAFFVETTKARISGMLNHRIRRPDGEVRYVRSRIEPEVSADGKSLVYHGTVQDITEQMEEENLLRETRDYLEKIFQSANAPIIVWNPELQITRFNSAAERMTGFDLKDVLGKELTFLFTRESLPQIRRQIEKAVKGDHWENLEMPILRRDGDIRIVLWNSSNIYKEDGVTLEAVVAQGQDITERKQVENALHAERALLAQRVEERTGELSMANAALSRAARMKDEFLASMSHELRTPLTGILGLAEALQTHAFGELSEKQQKSVQNIEESGRHLLDLINDILDLSKIEAGKTELNIAPLRVEDICQSSLRILRQSVTKKNLIATFERDPQVVSILADERRLKQILVNLLSNAVKFTPHGNTIGLRVKGNQEEKLVEFTVWDTGVGIAAHDLARLFQPFVQLDSRLSREYTGTGLGLALVSRLTEMHGGSVSVESEIGKGSTFKVSLPWRTLDDEEANGEDRQTSASRSEASVRRKSQDGKSILIVEDNEMTLTTFEDYLKVNGFRIFSARSGTEALSIVEENRPDIILMDIQMPGMDGLETMRRVRRMDGLADLPIIALTALVMAGDRERCLAAGANDYLSKPVRLNTLLEAIKRLLERGGNHV